MDSVVKLHPMTLCLESAHSDTLIPLASATASFDCPETMSSSSSTTTTAAASSLLLCDHSVPLLSSHSPIVLPDTASAAAAAALATAVNLKHLNEARARSPWANHSSVKCSGLEHLYTMGFAVQGTANSPNWKQEDYQDTRRKTCVFSRACVIDGRVTVYLPPEMKGKTPNAYNWMGFEDGMVHAYSWEPRWTRGSWDEGWHSSDGWSPEFVFGELPQGARAGFADDAGTHYMFRPTHLRNYNMNFGHLFIDDILSAFIAMQEFELEGEGGAADGRFVTVGARNWETDLSLNMLGQGCTPQLLQDGVTTTCRGRPTEALRAVFNRDPISLFSYPNATCFHRLVVGHTSAHSTAYRVHLRSIPASRFRDFYFERLGLAPPSVFLSLPPLILLYSKTHGHSGTVWPHLCSLAHALQRLVPSGRVLCVDFTQVHDLHLQLQMIGSAVLHITPHGAISDRLLFSRTGSSAIVLVDREQPAREMQTISTLTWLSVFYLHREDELELEGIVAHALLQACMRMNVACPAISCPNEL